MLKAFTTDSSDAFTSECSNRESIGEFDRVSKGVGPKSTPAPAGAFSRAPLETQPEPYLLPFESTRSYLLAKRSFDVVASLAALILFLPMIGVFAVLVYVTDPGPIFYCQERLGRNGRTFRCWKIRSMAVNADELLNALLRNDRVASREWEATRKLRNDPRVTLVGKLMRVTSIDELPQLLNILRGDMSIVGPRPITQSEIAFYGHRFETYCSVQPGLTGLWQVSGRSETTYRRRVALDVTYARKRTFALDALIILRTIPALAVGRGSW